MDGVVWGSALFGKGGLGMWLGLGVRIFRLEKRVFEDV